MKKLGFSFLELLIVMTFVAILSAIAAPKFMRQKEIALVEASAIELLSFLELGASESIKRGVKLHVHYIPKKKMHDGCIVLTESDKPTQTLCKGDTNAFKLAHDKALKIKQPVQNTPSKLFYFSPQTGLPSNDLTLLLSANLNDDKSSGILIRRYKGLVGCSQTGILDWQPCN